MISSLFSICTQSTNLLGTWIDLIGRMWVRHQRVIHSLRRVFLLYMEKSVFLLWKEERKGAEQEKRRGRERGRDMFVDLLRFAIRKEIWWGFHARSLSEESRDFREERCRSASVSENIKLWCWISSGQKWNSEQSLYQILYFKIVSVKYCEARFCRWKAKRKHRNEYFV